MKVGEGRGLGCVRVNILIRGRRGLQGEELYLLVPAPLPLVAQAAEHAQSVPVRKTFGKSELDVELWLQHCGEHLTYYAANVHVCAPLS